jgi:hypothetical protein
MVKKLSMRVKSATTIKASPLHVLFLQSLTCFLKKQVPTGFFEAAERILDPVDQYILS